MRVSGEVLASFNAAFEAILNNNLSELKQTLRNAPKSILNAQLSPSNLPTHLSAIGIKKFSLLHIACYLGHIALIKELVKHDANINATDETFGASCMHWAVFGQQYEAGLYLFFDLGCSIDVYNRFKQTPRALFAHPQEAWDFLFPSAYSPARLISAFRKIIETETRFSEHPIPTKIHLLLLNLSTFSKIMDSIQAGTYVRNDRLGAEMFFADLRQFFHQGRAFYAGNAEMKKILKTLKKLFKREVFYSSVDSCKKASKPLIPVNFATRAFGEVANVPDMFKVVESIRLSFPTINEGWLIGEQQGSGSQCFFYPLASQTSSGQVSVKIRLLPEGRSLLPALFINTQRIPTFTSSERSFEWTFSVKAGNNIIELFVATIKESEGRQRPKKTVTIQTTGEIRHLSTYLIFCTNQ